MVKPSMKEASRAKEILKELFWGFGKPKTLFQKRMRIVNRTVTILGFSYLVLLFHPQVLFAHSETFQNYTLHTNSPLPQAESRQLLERADSLLQKSDLYSTSRHHHIFLCNSAPLFTLFYPGKHKGVFAVSLATSNIFVQQGSLEQDLGWKASNTNIVRSLSGLVAHEVTHNFIRDHLGLWGSYQIPEWKAEGYCEYIGMHGQRPYELSLTTGMDQSVTPGYINPKYQRYLNRVLENFQSGEATFAHLLSAPDK